MPLFQKKFVGSLVKIGTSSSYYEDLLIKDEEVCMEFKGIRDALIFTDLRMIVVNPRGFTRRKVVFNSIPWKTISAFSVENAGSLGLDSELKVCGGGFGICIVEFLKGTDMSSIQSFIGNMVFGRMFKG